MIRQLLTVAALAAGGTGWAQNFQKMYGISGGIDQQALYGSLLDEEKNLYVSGTFRNLSTLTEPAFYGTVSKLDGAGNLLWYKSYMPSPFSPMEAYFINSIFEDEQHNLYTFGYFFGMGEGAGYYLQKITDNGAVVWSRFIANESPDAFAEATVGNGHIYVAMKDKVAAFDLNGNVVSAVQIEGLIARSILITSTGNLAITGEMLYEEEWFVPLFLLDSALGLLQSNLYNTGLNPFYGTALCEASGNSLIIGASDGLVLKVAANGTMDWSRLIETQESGDELLAIMNHTGILPVTQDGNSFFVLAQGFRSSNSDFQHSVIVYELGGDGAFSGFRIIDDSPFGEDGNLRPEALSIDPETNAYYVAGDLWVSDVTNHLNYVHQGKIDLMGCGEETTPFEVGDVVPGIETTPYPAALFTETTIAAVAATMVVTDLSPDLDSTYCEQALAIGDPETPVIGLFPNPAHDHLQVRLPAGATGPLIVHDASGRMVMSVPATADVLDVSSLTPGVYVLRLQVNDTAAAARFVKE